MKSKRWKRRNRHTRPEWVRAYKACEIRSSINTERVRFGACRKYYYPTNSNIKGYCRVVYIPLNTTPQLHQTLLSI